MSERVNRVSVWRLAAAEATESADCSMRCQPECLNAAIVIYVETSERCYSVLCLPSLINSVAALVLTLLHDVLCWQVSKEDQSEEQQQDVRVVKHQHLERYAVLPHFDKRLSL